MQRVPEYRAHVPLWIVEYIYSTLFTCFKILLPSVVVSTLLLSELSIASPVTPVNKNSNLHYLSSLLYNI